VYVYSRTRADVYYVSVGRWPTSYNMSVGNVLLKWMYEWIYVITTWCNGSHKISYLSHYHSIVMMYPTVRSFLFFTPHPRSHPSFSFSSSFLPSFFFHMRVYQSLPPTFLYTFIHYISIVRSSSMYILTPHSPFLPLLFLLSSSYIKFTACSVPKVTSSEWKVLFCFQHLLILHNNWYLLFRGDMC